MLEPIPRDAQQESWERLRPMQPERFAEQALRAVAKNHAIIVIPSWYRIVWWLYRLSPSLGFYLAALDRKKYLETAQRALERVPPYQPLQPTAAVGSAAGAVTPSDAAPAAEPLREPLGSFHHQRGV